MPQRESDSSRKCHDYSGTLLGVRVSLTQKSVYRMELGTHDLRRSTVVTVEQVLKAEGVEFEDLPDGGFKVVVPEPVLAKHQRDLSFTRIVGYLRCVPATEKELWLPHDGSALTSSRNDISLVSPRTVPNARTSGV